MEPSFKSVSWRMRWLAWRNRTLASAQFQRGVATVPLIRWVARRRAARLFERVAGFVYTQVLSAAIETDLLRELAGEPRAEASLAGALGLSGDATSRLLRAAAALDLTQEAAPGLWTLGEDGAALLGNPGAQAMIRHHRLLYADLADPVALLRNDRATPTRLSRFWHYDTAAGEVATPYSELMAASQTLVAEQVVRAYRLARHRALLDVGGGHGVFLRAAADVAPALRLGLFDLPDVIAGARERFGEAVPTFHPGDFFADALPRGYDLISLIRVLHDHDDAPASALLRAIRAALAPGDHLLIAEPMAGTRGARAMGDAYFGLYLWAMRSGRARRVDEIGAMLRQAGFASWREVPTALPLIARIVVAQA